MAKVFTLVMTDGNYMDVQVFYGKAPPTIEEMFLKIDFDRSTELENVLYELRNKIDVRKKDDYVVLHYDDVGKKYMFHLKCHDLKDLK